MHTHNNWYDAANGDLMDLISKARILVGRKWFLVLPHNKERKGPLNFLSRFFVIGPFFAKGEK